MCIVCIVYIVYVLYVIWYNMKEFDINHLLKNIERRFASCP